MGLLMKRIVELTLFIYFTLFMLMIDLSFPYKSLAVYLICIVTFFVLLWHRKRCAEIAGLFINYGDNRFLSKAAAYFSMSGWLSFALFLPFLILNARLVANLFLISFCLLIIISSMLMLYTNDSPFKKKVFSIEFISVASLAYAVSSAYSSGLFLQLSNMSIENSPWVAFCWKFVAFVVLVSIFLQPITYWVFIRNIEKAKGAQILTILGSLIVTSFIILLLPHFLSGIAYITLNKSIGFEWRDEATCGNIIDKAKGEKYFGFDTDKYTVYFPERNGKWGFDELKCIKNEQGSYEFHKKNISTEMLSDWVK